jgi:hypothetical protein
MPWHDLVGVEVQFWLGGRLPFWEDPERFTHPDFACVQVMSLEAVADGRYLKISAFASGLVEETDYLEHELVLRDFQESSLLPSNSADAGLRNHMLDELPTGRITAIGVRVESSWVQEVLLTLADGRRLLLVAGETEETWAGPLIWRRSDESILVFLEPDDVATVPWNPPRGARAQSH